MLLFYAMIAFRISDQFPVSTETIYKAWLNSESHTAMTGGEAQCSDRVGDGFTAWDGYISGENVELKPFERIVQKWRTTEFAESDADSQLEITLRDVEGRCELILYHSNIPDGQSDYEQGWKEHYFVPMHEYFG